MLVMPVQEALKYEEEHNPRHDIQGRVGPQHIVTESLRNEMEKRASEQSPYRETDEMAYQPVQTLDPDEHPEKSDQRSEPYEGRACEDRYIADCRVHCSSRTTVSRTGFATLLIFILLVAGQSTFAQTRDLSGIIIDSTGALLPGVNVVIEELKVGTASDVDGRFRLADLGFGRYTLVCSAVGFRTTRLTVEIGTGTDAFVRVILQEISFLSNEIIVTASRRAQLSSSAPVSYSLIKSHDLKVRNIVALDQALRYVPGVQVMENQVNIRGSSGYAYNVGSRVLLLLDGVPLLTPDSDGVPFEALPFNQTEQIEIIKGPVSRSGTAAPSAV